MMNHPLFKAYLQLPIWAKVVGPAALIVAIVALINTLSVVVKVGIVVLFILAVITLVSKFQGNKKE